MAKRINPSNILEEAGSALDRFPVTSAVSALATIFGMILIGLNNPFDRNYGMQALLLTALIGIPLFFCIKVYVEISGGSALKMNIFRALAFVLLIGLFFTFPQEESFFNSNKPYIRYAILNICLHLAVSFLPFIKEGHLNGFWQYNRVLFLRFLTAVFFSGIVFTGLSIAFLVLGPLFDIVVSGEFYGYLACLVFILFNTWFFLAGIPRDFSNLDSIEDYPKSLKVFSLYILLPLLVVYLVILYAYVFKIIITRTWPEGIITYMILAVAIAGILNLLLLYPLSRDDQHPIVTSFYKLYFLMMLPLIVVLFLAIGIRVNDYGITIERYIVILLGAWLLMMSMYFIISGKRNIKLIPVSLCLIFLGFSFGPWGIFAVSERSQVNRLKQLLEKNGILENDKVRNELSLTDNSTIPSSQYYFSTSKRFKNSDQFYEIKSITKYLANNHSLTALNNWFSQDMQALAKEHDQTFDEYDLQDEYQNLYFKAMNLGNGDKKEKDRHAYSDTTNTNPEGIRDRITLHSYEIEEPDFHRVAGYDLFKNFGYRIKGYDDEDRDKHTLFEVKDGARSLAIQKTNPEKSAFLVLSRGKVIDTVSINELLQRLETYYDIGRMGINPDSMRTTVSNEMFDMEIRFEEINYKKDEKADTIQFGETYGHALIKWK